jgi:hypothetical protein
MATFHDSDLKNKIANQNKANGLEEIKKSIGIKGQRKSAAHVQFCR